MLRLFTEKYFRIDCNRFTSDFNVSLKRVKNKISKHLQQISGENCIMIYVKWMDMALENLSLSKTSGCDETDYKIY